MFNLYLDDLRPGPYNNDIYEGWEDWVIVRSIANAKTLLLTGLVNDMSLDHDMGYDSRKSKQPNPDGKSLVMWMVEENCWPKGIITIHSAHIGRAKEMKELIDRYRPQEIMSKNSPKKQTNLARSLVERKGSYVQLTGIGPQFITSNKQDKS